MSNALGYFTFETPDIATARTFYGGLLGWRFDEAASHETYAHVAAAGPAGAPAFGIVKGEHRDFTHLYFRVDDIDAAAARAVALGGRAAVPAESSSGRTVAVCDDQGVSISLWQPAPGYAAE